MANCSTGGASLRARGYVQRQRPGYQSEVGRPTVPELVGLHGVGPAHERLRRLPWQIPAAPVRP